MQCRVAVDVSDEQSATQPTEDVDQGEQTLAAAPLRLPSADVTASETSRGSSRSSRRSKDSSLSFIFGGGGVDDSMFRDVRDAGHKRREW